MDRIGVLTVVSDVSPAHWLAGRLHAAPLDVGAVVPKGYAAYLRIFHPAVRNDLATGREYDFPGPMSLALRAGPRTR